MTSAHRAVDKTLVFSILFCIAEIEDSNGEEVRGKVYLAQADRKKETTLNF